MSHNIVIKTHHRPGSCGACGSLTQPLFMLSFFFFSFSKEWLGGAAGCPRCLSRDRGFRPGRCFIIPLCQRPSVPCQRGKASGCFYGAFCPRVHTRRQKKWSPWDTTSVTRLRTRKHLSVAPDCTLKSARFVSLLYPPQET